MGGDLGGGEAAADVTGLTAASGCGRGPVDDPGMDPLPSIPTLPSFPALTGLRRQPEVAGLAALMAPRDPKALRARRERRADLARRPTSVAPPARRR
jgi:hypothetical protein